MEATNQIVCPFCGSGSLGLRYGANEKPYFACYGCCAEGPLVEKELEALNAFCRPAHLMENLHTYDPNVAELRAALEVK